MEFRERLFELRRQAGLSQEELANLLDVTRQAVQKWESGASRPDMDNLAALADYFHVSLDYLILGREETGKAAPDAVVEVHNHYYRWHYEYKSKRTLFGLPLVHINIGPGLCRAKGIVAIGDIALGLIAMGGLSAGLFSLGGVSLGLLLALGGAAIGGCSVGGLSFGLLAWGGLAFGLISYGGIACGLYAAGGVVKASRVAIGAVASAPLAIGNAAEGAQTFTLPLSAGELAAARQALATACRGAPEWVCRLLQMTLA